MKTLALGLFLLASSALAEKPNPADFKLVIHVIGAEKAGAYQQLEAVINGQTVGLRQADIAGGLFALGDYPAMIVPQPGAKNAPSYQVVLRYRILFPDGVYHDYDVVAVGTFAGVPQTAPAP